LDVDERDITSAKGKYSITFAHASGGNVGNAAAAAASTVILARFDDLSAMPSSFSYILIHVH
jgi:hypothetical protein